ncbi:MAG: hypothetical protein GY869_14415 [Planctomycetes bacterium]|nr:hypothetical protein [Planctomycetota bacterium]
MKKNRGSLNFLTLASSLILVALVLGTVTITMQFRRYAQTNFQGELAQHYAQHGINHAIYYTNIEPNWRNILSSGIWLQDIAVDQATYTVEGIDNVDADLATGANDPVLFISTATVGTVSRTVQVEVAPETATDELMHYALATGNDIEIKNAGIINGNTTSNGKIKKTGGSTFINGDAEAVGTVSNTNNITGVISPDSDPKEFPDTAAILQYYTSVATDIPYQATIENILLSPTNNPLGPVNPLHGVYRIDCGGADISIQNCRIVGTLILVNCGGNSQIQQGINWQPARPDYPALICYQTITFAQDQDLDEAGLNTDFSLLAEPGNSSITDVYPNRIQGTIYVDGDVNLSNTAHLVGTVITTDLCDVSNDAVIDWDPTILDNPTKCFSGEVGKLVPTPGTWRQVIR